MKLNIIIVSWNTAELTLKCLKSIFKYLDLSDYSAQGGPASGWEVFVVDNNSTDRTTELITELIHQHKNLYLIQNKENMGFTAANNQAIRQAKGEYVLLLNPDTELIDESLLKMIEFADKNQVGIVGPKLLNTDGTLQRSCRQFPKLLDQLFIQLKFYNFFPDKIKSVREYFMLDFKHNEIREVDQVMGAAILIRHKIFDKIGLLDEKYWAIFEEVDFCQRAKKAGYKVCFYPATEIMHHKESSFIQMANLRKQINFNHSLYHYFYKHKPFWQLFILWLIQPINLFLTWLDSLVGIRRRVGKRKDL